MRNLLSSKERRQLELMEFLVTSHEWIHLKSLAEKFLCTERILKQDLAELREIFPQVTIHSSTNGIRAHFSKEASIEDIYRYKRQSKNVQKWEFKNVQFYSFNTSFKR